MKLPFGGSAARATTLDAHSGTGPAHGFDPTDPTGGTGSGSRAYRLTRTAGIDANPQAYAQRAAAFAQTATAAGGTATIVVARTGSATESWVIVSDAAAAANAQITFAQTVGGRAEPDPGPDLLGSTPVITRLEHVPSPLIRDPQLGYDPTQIASMISTALRDGSWLAVTVRPASARELRTWRRWLDFRFGTHNHTHHSLQAGALITSFTAGGPNRQAADAVLQSAVAAMPGFDLRAASVPAPGRPAAIKPLALGAAALAGAVIVPPLLTETLTGLDTGTPTLDALLPLAAVALGWVLGIAGLVLGIPAALKLFGVVPTEDTRLRKALDAGTFPAPAIRRGRVRPPREARTKITQREVNGMRVPVEKHIKEFAGDYPLHPTSFLLGASVWAGIASPHGTSGEVTTAVRNVPPAMTRPIGPLIGHSEGTPVYLDAEMMTMGTALLGRPGSGKSVTVRTLFAWSCMERVNPSPIPGSPGKANTLIAFENKGDGMEDYVAWANEIGDTIHTIDVMDPTTYSLDLFAVDGTIADKAAFFAGAMQYAFGDQAIADRSLYTLRQVLTAGLAVTDELIATIRPEDPAAERTFTPGRSPVYWADVLLGGRGDAHGVTLYNAIRAAATTARDTGTPDADLDIAVDMLAPLYDGKTEANRRAFQEAPRSKTGQLLNMERWFTPQRKRISWEHILNNHQSVVINTGSSTAGMMEDRDSHVISSMIMYSLRRAIQVNCSKWEKQGRSVSIFADELSLLAGTSETVIGWLRDQGRSFGIRAIFATQRPEQLGPQLRNNLLTFSTLISYAQNDVVTSREIAANMGPAWSEEDLNNLPPYHTVIRAEVGKTRQPSFTAAMLDSESDRSTFIATQRSGQVPGTEGIAPGYDAQWTPDPAAAPTGYHPATPAGPMMPPAAPSRYGVSAPPPGAQSPGQPPVPPTTGQDPNHYRDTPGGTW